MTPEIPVPLGRPEKADPMASKLKPNAAPNLELVGAATAPIFHFDVAPVFGVLPGVGRLTISAFVQTVGSDGTPGMQQVAIAHLRGNVPAMRSLKEAIDGILAMADGEAALEARPNWQGPARADN